MKKFLKVTILFFMIISLLLYSTKIYAANLNELEKERNSINNEISETSEELEDIVSAKTETLKEVEKLISEISSYQAEVDELNDQINVLKSKIKETEKQIEIDEEEYKKQEEILDKILIAIYESGDISYLKVLMSSSNIVDAMSINYVYSQVVEYSSNLIETVLAHKEKLEKEKNELIEDNEKLEQSQKAVVEKKQVLEEKKKSKQDYVDKLSDEERAIEKKLQELQDTNDELDRKIKQAQEEFAKAKAENEAASRANSGGSATTIVNNGKTSNYGLIWPVSTKFNYISATWYYSSGKLHGATDIAGSGIYGTPIYAVADGYVIESSARLDSNGNYISYGNYVMIAHYNGLYTLYGHMMKRAVSAGQKVTQGQVIGYVGSTGNSTGPHLHFEVRTGNGTYAERVNPLYYLPKN